MKRLNKKQILLVMFLCLLIARNMYLQYQLIEKDSAYSGFIGQNEALKKFTEFTGRYVNKVLAGQTEIMQGWSSLMAGDYLLMSQKQEMIENAVVEQLVEHHSDIIVDTNRTECLGTCILQTKNGLKELYLVQHKNANQSFINNISGILVDYDNNTSEILFQANDYAKISDFYDFNYLYDTYVSDLDGNGEEDFVLFLGINRTAGPEYYLPDLFCIIGLQENGEFSIISDETETWLYNVIYELFSEPHESRKIENILSSIRTYFSLDSNDEYYNSSTYTEKNIGDYIKAKDNKMMKLIVSRSLFSEQELIWQNFYLNEDRHIQSIKIFKEHGENGNPPEQIVVYIFDYVTEEVEKQEVPSIYQSLCDRDGYFKTSIETQKIEYTDVNGDSLKDITIYFKYTFNGGKKEELYKVNFIYDKNAENTMKLFNAQKADRIARY